MGITRAVAFEPGQVADAVIAEFVQGGIADHALGFMLEIIKHGLRAVAETCGLLVLRAATGVHHPSALGTGTAAHEAVGNHHPGTSTAGLQRSAGTRRAPADHQYIAGVMPIPGAEAISVQGREDLAVAGGFCAPAHDSTRTLALAGADTALAIWLAAI